MALVATTEDVFNKAVADPFINGTNTGGVTHKAKDQDVHIARAILMHMWLEARQQWDVHVALPTSLTTTPTPTTPTTSTPSNDDTMGAVRGSLQCQAPRRATSLLPHQNVAGGGRNTCQDPSRTHQEQDLHCPVRSYPGFQPSGELNPLAQRRAANGSTGVQTLRLEKGDLVATSEKE